MSLWHRAHVRVIVTALTRGRPTFVWRLTRLWLAVRPNPDVIADTVVMLQGRALARRREVLPAAVPLWTSPRLGAAQVHRVLAGAPTYPLIWATDPRVSALLARDAIMDQQWKGWERAFGRVFAVACNPALTRSLLQECSIPVLPAS
jgi:hypothetical protein